MPVTCSNASFQQEAVINDLAKPDAAFVGKEHIHQQCQKARRGLVCVPVTCIMQAFMHQEGVRGTWRDLMRPSKEKGVVTIATVRMPMALAAAATTGAAPLPVPPPMPACTHAATSQSCCTSVMLNTADALVVLLAPRVYDIQACS